MGKSWGDYHGAAAAANNNSNAYVHTYIISVYVDFSLYNPPTFLLLIFTKPYA